MSKFMTFTEASTRFANLASTGIAIGPAIQEAVDMIYDQGRWPGTTYELPIAEGDFGPGVEDNELFLDLPFETYDGVIGFRDASQGFGIQDITSLYRINVNAGDMDFIDMGLVAVGDDTFRRYRAPLGWRAARQPLYALLKKQPPVLTGTDPVPVYSVSALKAAIEAVCCEYVSDLERAQFHWSRFEQRMIQSEKQFSGNKRFSIGIDSSYRRRPTQMM